MALCMVSFLGLITTSFAERFGNVGGHFWADTPIGRLDCHEEDELQVIKIGDKEEYRKPNPFGPNSDRKGGSILPYGIQGGIGCPKFIANESGYVVYEYEQTQEISNNPLVDIPDVSGVMNYEIINFNASPPTTIILTQVKYREGKTYQPRFTWDKNGFTLRYYGYPFDKMWEYPKPKIHTIRFDFSSQKISRVK